MTGGMPAAPAPQIGMRAAQAAGKRSAHRYRASAPTGPARTRRCAGRWCDTPRRASRSAPPRCRHRHHASAPSKAQRCTRCIKLHHLGYAQGRAFVLFRSSKKRFAARHLVAEENAVEQRRQGFSRALSGPLQQVIHSGAQHQRAARNDCVSGPPVAAPARTPACLVHAASACSGSGVRRIRSQPDRRASTGDAAATGQLTPVGTATAARADAAGGGACFGPRPPGQADHRRRNRSAPANGSSLICSRLAEDGNCAYRGEVRGEDYINTTPAHQLTPGSPSILSQPRHLHDVSPRLPADRQLRPIRAALPAVPWCSA